MAEPGPAASGSPVILPPRRTWRDWSGRGRPLEPQQHGPRGAERHLRRGRDRLLGLIGLFSRCCSRPSPLVTWLADASYWMYLVHVPLVMAAQLLVRPWAMPLDLKFLLVMVLVAPVLLVSYRYGVRFTAIGRLLNGPRGRAPARMASAVGP